MVLWLNWAALLVFHSADTVSLFKCHTVVEVLPCLVLHMTEVISDLLNVI